MGIVLAFAVGYFVGAKAGEDGYQDVVDALQAIKESGEFRDLLAALRAHGSSVLRQLSAYLDSSSSGPSGSSDDATFNPADLLDRVRGLMDRGGRSVE